MTKTFAKWPEREKQKSHADILVCSMETKREIIEEATKTLNWLFETYKHDGLISVYLWGSIITPDFNPTTSDIDAVAFLSDEADFSTLNKIRDWLPNKNPKLVRLQINFFYLSELTNEKPVRSHLARLSTPGQAVFDFPYWRYVCGEKINGALFPKVSPRQFLHDQMTVVREREEWAKHPKTANDMQYYCKSLVWLCWAIHKLQNTPSVFSWQTLKDEATGETLPLVNKLAELKKSDWNEELLKENLAVLVERTHSLINRT